MDADYPLIYSDYKPITVTNKNNNAGIAAADLASLRALQPGTTVDLQISTPTSPKRVKTVYVGMDYPRCMIFQTPNINKYGITKDLLYSNNTVIIRYVLEGSAGQVIAFKAKINHIQSSPSQLFFTTVPTSLQSLGLRSEKRASPGIASEITFSSVGSSKKSLIVDVSQSGCRIAIDEDELKSLDGSVLDADSDINICVDLSEKTLILDGIIRNSKSEDGYVFVGVQFKSISNDIDVLLKRHIINV
ncbi:flagellar brake domain-containing protein [Alteromonas oceanisediminis]|uniref:flagellar brake domain-containing protein n=1 Tax=Alteromonas oceanisediminis TaxID=2836180 RepID=UPI001BDA2EED|nr:PilZ domain-containing protein [Alteromonas oceanisediminis]MBT0587193.1 flagellar brake domain-containing protein [Alteromonas oceanisediminis]